jgi:hypothetical protein
VISVGCGANGWFTIALEISGFAQILPHSIGTTRLVIRVGVVDMSVSNELRYLAEQHASGALSEDAYAVAKGVLLDEVEEAEIAMDANGPAIEAELPEPQVVHDLMHVALLGSIVLSLLTTLAFGLSWTTGATIGIAVLGAVTFLWHRNTDDGSKEGSNTLNDLLTK